MTTIRTKAVFLILTVFALSLAGCGDSSNYMGEMRSPQDLSIQYSDELHIEDGNFVEIGTYGITLTDTANITGTTTDYLNPDSVTFSVATIDSTRRSDFYLYNDTFGIVTVLQSGLYRLSYNAIMLTDSDNSTGHLQRANDGEWQEIKATRILTSDTLEVGHASIYMELEENDSIRAVFASETGSDSTIMFAGSKVQIYKVSKK